MFRLDEQTNAASNSTLIICTSSKLFDFITGWVIESYFTCIKKLARILVMNITPPPSGTCAPE